jgi:hypothetical protein
MRVRGLRSAVCNAGASLRIAICFVALGISGAAGRAQQNTQDSAGVPIRAISLGGSRGQLTLAAQPALIIGTEPGTGPYEFHRIKAIIRRGDGAIVVANGGTLEIRLFDSNGKIIRSIGGKGAGPGEFQAFSQLVVLERDSLLVSDELQRRYSVFGPDGKHARTVILTPPPGRVRADFKLILRNGGMFAGSLDIAPSQPRKEAYYSTQHLFSYNADGTAGKDVGTFGVWEHVIHATTPQFGGVAYYDLAFGRTTTLAAHGNRILAGDGSGFELRYYSPTGSLQEILRAAEPREEVTQQDRDGYRQLLMLTARPEQKTAMEKLADEMPYPREIPSFRRFVVAAGGRIWVQRYLRSSTKTDIWVVLEADGRFVDEIAMPRRFQVMSIGPDYVLGVARDSDGIELVHQLRIVEKAK